MAGLFPGLVGGPRAGLAPQRPGRLSPGLGAPGLLPPFELTPVPDPGPVVNPVCLGWIPWFLDSGLRPGFPLLGCLDCLPAPGPHPTPEHRITAARPPRHRITAATPHRYRSTAKPPCLSTLPDSAVPSRMSFSTYFRTIPSAEGPELRFPLHFVTEEEADSRGERAG